MLDADRERALDVEFERRAVDVLRRDLHAQRTLDVGVDAREGQTTLLVDLLARLLEDARIDQHVRLAALLGHVHHEHLAVRVHLGRREADAGGVVHRLEHVGDELLEFRVEHGHRRRLRAQPRVGELEDREQGHGVQMRATRAEGKCPDSSGAAPGRRAAAESERRPEPPKKGTGGAAPGRRAGPAARSGPLTACDTVRYSRHNFCITLGKTFGDRGIGRHA